MRVEQAVAETGYVVNRFASALRSGRSTIVTMFVSSLLNPHFANATQGMIDAFEGSRYHLMFAQTGYGEALERDVVSTAMQFQPAAVVFTDVVRSDQTRHALQNLGVPVMELWGFRPDPIDMLVASSGFDGGFLMGEHFGASDYRTIAYSGHTQRRGDERIAGFRAGLAKYGLEPAGIFPMEGTRSIIEGMTVLDDILAELPECDAIFFGTDILAIGALLRARKLGISVPERLAIAGYGDLDFARHVEPPLTSVQVSSYEMGRRAGEMLLQRLDSDGPSQSVVVQPVRLQVRESTRR